MKLVDLLSGYADADWGNSSSRRSTSGIIMVYNKSPIVWKSKMQKTTAISTAEVECYSASAAGREVLYLRDLLRRLGFGQRKPTPIYKDNATCIEWGNRMGTAAASAGAAGPFPGTTGRTEQRAD